MLWETKPAFRDKTVIYFFLARIGLALAWHCPSHPQCKANAKPMRLRNLPGKKRLDSLSHLKMLKN
jgi:hypothetical protein